MKSTIFKNHIAKNVLSALAVVVFGLILLNLAFVIDYLFQSLIKLILGLFTPTDFNMTYWYPPLMHILFLCLIGFISWLIFRSKLGVLYKAIYVTVPLAAFFATIGMFLYPWPIAGFLLGGLFFIIVFYYLHRTKQPWLYYFSLVLIGLVMLAVGIFGVEI